MTVKTNPTPSSTHTKLSHTKADFIAYGREAIGSEIEAIKDLLPRVDNHFSNAVALLLNATGHIICTGIGKSGHIARKIASTLASTGTPAFYLHPGEALHGDLGMITSDDTIIALSNSGESAELLSLIPSTKALGTKLLALTGNDDSTLAQHATVHINVGVSQEACPLNLAPTSSTTVALVMGDAIAIACLRAKGFTASDFALSHPGGQLGRRLLCRAEDVMRAAKDVPTVAHTLTIYEALEVISQKGLGLACIENENNELIGVFSDGDCRRAIIQGIDFKHTLIDSVIHTPCITAKANQLAAETLSLMEHHKITVMPVVNEHNSVIGIIHLHDLLQAGGIR